MLAIRPLRDYDVVFLDLDLTLIDDGVMYQGAELLLNMLFRLNHGKRTVIMSVTPDNDAARWEKRKSLGKFEPLYPVIFFESDAQKLEFIRRYALKDDVILDSDLNAVSGQICDTVWINCRDGYPLIDLVNHWRTETS